MTVPAEAAALTARHADLGDLTALLRDQHGRKVDVVAPPGALRARGGMLVIAGIDPVLTDTGGQKQPSPTRAVDMGVRSDENVVADDTGVPRAAADDGVLHHNGAGAEADLAVLGGEDGSEQHAGAQVRCAPRRR